MLYEIYCEKFINKKITFNEGLSVVLGTDFADNSIGKSTFLMIVDYAFGGKTYSKADDITKNVGEHEIFFTFKFGDKFYKFCRNNINADKIWKCNDNNEKIEELDLKKYTQELSKLYNILLPDMSFRDAVGRYIRVYGKENCDEKHPLQYQKREKNEQAIFALLKLFNLYENIKKLKINANEADENLKIYKKAQSLNFVEKITKEDFNKNIKRINSITIEINKLCENLDKGLIDIDSSVSDEAIKIKNLLSKNKRARTKLNANYKTMDENCNYKFSSISTNFNELSKFFANVNIAHIEEIENFHSKISNIFKEELKTEKNKLKLEIAEYDKIIKELESKLNSLISTPNLSKFILSKHSELLKEKENLQKQNSSYNKLKNFVSIQKETNQQLKDMKTKVFAELQFNINEEMKKLNDIIYNGNCNSPIIAFTDKSYSFYTPNDTGTGIACKGMVVFDLAVLNMTKLPLLVHDSVFLKQISDNAIEKILDLYSLSNKQIIIALDKQRSYSEKTTKKLQACAVLKLGEEKQALFGKSWG